MSQDPVPMTTITLGGDQQRLGASRGNTATSHGLGTSNLTPALSGVASLERATEPHEGNTGHLSSDDNEEGHGHSNATLCGDPHSAVQKFRCEVRAVTPYDGV